MNLLPDFKRNRLPEYERADRLARILKKAGKICHNPNTAAWAGQLRLLHSKNPDLDEVMNWLTDHIKDFHCPDVRSPKTLQKNYRKLQQLVAAYKAEATEEAKRISTEVEHLMWPVPLKEVQLSIDRSLLGIRKLGSALKIIAVTSNSYKCRPIAQECLSHIYPPLPFVLQWYTDLWKELNGWAGFSGNMIPFEISPDSKRVRKLLRFYAIGFGFSEGQVQDFFELLDYELSKKK